ncbi:MAG: hypothetical protein RIM84_03460 [Alphaproteobacteria bacterium]
MSRPAGWTRSVYPVVCLLLFAIAVAPLWLVEHPPLQDYFNLLARLRLLTDPDHPAFDSYYRIEWRFLPALGLELVAIPLTTLVAPAAAIKLTVTLCFAGLIATTMAVHRGLYGGTTPVTALAFLLLWNEATHVGLIGYLVGCVLALALIALWLRLAERPGPRLAICLPLAVLLLLAHLYAFAFMGLALAAVEVTAAARHGNWGRRFLHLALLALVPALCLLLLGPALDAYRAPETGGDTTGMFAELVEQSRLYFHRKGLYLWYLIGGDIVNGRPMELVARVTGAIVAMLAILTLIAARRLPAAAALAVLALMLAVYLVLPPRLAGSFVADWRLLIPVGFFALAALPAAPEREMYRAVEVTVVVAVAVLLSWRAWDIQRTWQGAQHHIADFDAATAALPDGAKLYPYVMQVPWVGPQYRRDTRFLIHIASRAVDRNAALVPTQFATPAAQALRFQPDYDEVRLPWADKLEDRVTVHWDDVLGFFDHVLVVKLSDLPDAPDVGLPGAGLKLVGEAGVFRLYEIERGDRDGG